MVIKDILGTIVNEVTLYIVHYITLYIRTVVTTVTLGIIVIKATNKTIVIKDTWATKVNIVTFGTTVI